MKSLLLIMPLLFMNIHCASEENPAHLSAMGFYASPQEIIELLADKKDKSSHEHYLLGLTYKKIKNYKKSLFHFTNSAFKSHRDNNIRLYAHPVYTFLTGFHIKSNYYDDAVYEIAELFFKYGEYKYLPKYLDLISAKTRGLYRQAAILKSQSLARLKKHQEALMTMEKIKNEYEDITSQLIILIRIASIHEDMGNSEKAINTYIKVIETVPDSWQATVAGKEIINIMAKKKIMPTEEQKLPIAKGLFYGRRYNDATAVLRSSKTINNKDQDIYLARSITRQRNFNALTHMLQSKKNDNHYDDLVYAIAKELWLMRNKSLAITYYNQLLNSQSNDYKQKALEKIATYYEDRRIAGYQSYLSKYKSSYKDNSSAHFLWLLARNNLRNSDIKPAHENLQEALLNYPNAKDSDKCRFWLYKIYSSKDNQKSMQFAAELMTNNPNSSYTWFMLDKLKNNFTNSTLTQNYKNALNNKNKNEMILYHTLLFIKEKDFKKRNNRLKEMGLNIIDKHNRIAKKILSLDLTSKYSELLKNVGKYFLVGDNYSIYRELDLIPDKEEYNQDKFTALAYWGQKFNNYFHMANGTEELYKIKKIKENIALMPQKTVTMLLPEVFKKCVDMYSKKYQVTTAEIYAVIKAESIFNHKAVSSAGAIGLMQLMPATARGIARQLNMTGYQLKKPCTSIQFGTKYISWLKKYFKNNFAFVVAGYNAGAGNVNKWKKKLNTQDMDYFTEFVPFFETRYYILRTTKFLLQYETIYP